MPRTVTILLAASVLSLLLVSCAKPVSPAEPPAEDVVVADEVAPEAPPPDERAAPGETDKYEVKTTEAGSIEDTVAGVDLLVARDQSGAVTVSNRDAGEEIVEERGFWFARYAFHPETALYGRQLAGEG